MILEPKMPSRFASWERANLEKLAEDLMAELKATQEDFRAAMDLWRQAIKEQMK